ncbi:adenosylmethionine--8-amino-7-oxononanoate transaminase [Mannheimia haemolytica]|uniref:Adenosylmethionine--8-amino-7-oxononanoate transaminase n=1 Tax=Mannheimia haemolytica TaxID=75985 RepID=A0A378MXT0_MANHA|nr:adenosylmethionine--8-amino-7-oxononanoate transaminase [Mannheimia haemolytica]
MFYARSDVYGKSTGVCGSSRKYQLLLASPWQQRIQQIEQQLRQELRQAEALDCVAEMRVLGAIG